MIASFVPSRVYVFGTRVEDSSCSRAREYDRTHYTATGVARAYFLFNLPGTRTVYVYCIYTIRPPAYRSVVYRVRN